MNNTKNNPGPKNSNPLKRKKMQHPDRHERFVQWLTMLLRDDHGRAVIRAMVEQNEMPVIDLAHRKRGTKNMPVYQQTDFQQSNQSRS